MRDSGARLIPNSDFEQVPFDGSCAMRYRNPGATLPCGMFINDIRVEVGTIYAGDESSGVAGRSILVGATDPDSWRYELELGHSGADAKTLVWVELKVPSVRWAPMETIGLHVAREDSLRTASIAAIPALLRAAWEINDNAWSEDEARMAVCGRVIDG